MTEDQDEWRFSLADLEDDPADDAEAEEGGNIAGDFLPDETLEHGDVDFENAVFVALGAALAALAFVAFVVALT